MSRHRCHSAYVHPSIKHIGDERATHIVGRERFHSRNLRTSLDPGVDCLICKS